MISNCCGADRKELEDYRCEDCKEPCDFECSDDCDCNDCLFAEEERKQDEIEDQRFEMERDIQRGIY